MNRRSFIEKTAIGAAGAIITPATLPVLKRGTVQSSAPVISNNIVYAAESGNYGKKGLFILGFLMGEGDNNIYENQLVTLRNTYNYRSKLTYNSNDQHKFFFTRNVINYFISTGTLSFAALAIIFSGDVLVSPQQFYQGKRDAYLHLLSLAGIDNTLVSVVQVKSQSPFGPSQLYSNDFSTATNGITLQAVNTINSNLLQTAGLLTGCIRQDILGNVKPSSVKYKLTQHLKESLSVISLSPPVTSGTKFQIFN